MQCKGISFIRLDAKKRLVLPLEIRCMLSDPKAALILLSVKKTEKGRCFIEISSAQADSDEYRSNSKNVKQKLDRLNDASFSGPFSQKRKLEV
jgi:hypothetical protein